MLCITTTFEQHVQEMSQSASITATPYTLLLASTLSSAVAYILPTPRQLLPLIATSQSAGRA